MTPVERRAFLKGIFADKAVGDTLYETKKMINSSSMKNNAHAGHFVDDLVNRTLAKYGIVEYEGSHRFVSGNRGEAHEIPEGIYDDIQASIEKNVVRYLKGKGVLE